MSSTGDIIRLETVDNRVRHTKRKVHVEQKNNEIPKQYAGDTENTLAMTHAFNIHFINFSFFDAPNKDGEIGNVEFTTTTDENINSYAIWFDEDGNHYVCLPTNEFDEDDEEVLYDVLFTDIVEQIKTYKNEAPITIKGESLNY